MATIGQQLTAPESSWKRYDDTDSNIYYNEMIKLVSSGACYFGACHIQEVSTSDTCVKFNFYGTKIRIISYSHPAEDGIYTITIDNSSDTFQTVYGTNIYQVLVYEKTNLANTIHSVIIKGEVGKRFVFDALDIDSTGQLKPYTQNKYLIKDGERVKTTTDGINLIDLGTEYNETIFNTYGINDLSLLNSTIINKIINNQYKILMYKKK